LGRVLERLAPIRRKRERIGEKDASAALEKGAARAKGIAEKTMREVRSAIGL
jgi:hypothetical protein